MADDEAVQYALEQAGISEMKLKEEQIATISMILKGRDVFVWLPTGFGKSVCFETLPFIFDYKLGRIGTQACSLVIVLSPLIALIVNQVTNLRQCGIKAAIMSSSSRISSTLQAIEDDLRYYNIVYAIPEAILKQRWRDVIETPEMAKRIVANVVDEAHCVSKWSKDFRTTYGKIHEIWALVPQHVPFMAYTSTATKSVRDDVAKYFFAVKPRTEIELDLSSLINSLRIDKNNAARVIVYCPSLNMCSDLYATFHYELGFDSYYPPGSQHTSQNRLFGMYHSNTPQYNKDVVLKSMEELEGVVRIVFATGLLEVLMTAFKKVEEEVELDVK
ncbi:PREDICTED: mediator of RNA polymerase II transcription subunit 34-like [Amphimedon queenslandica]|uniref:Helicase ATP-binding domain-containing protein n=1 Tax=Amphimedon queenslandica TaxID=400682 RepID=A0AAN0JUH0_AMPQE|nr:PREDICTED: mediator of RNA polymerase II transcription subunit 34-like [Amphimedon queenslandica]|eukprot:XP_019860537.1 PREDICTED: mediator of RNA polymerase II transcription subunit 34-like [Amphimedon queenslandica]